MKLSKKEVEHVALLARLELTEEEKERFAEQLSDILTYVEKLQELDTTDVPPTSHVLPLTNVMRQDEPRESLPVEEVLANAPDAAAGCFRVPRIIED